MKSRLTFSDGRWTSTLQLLCSAKGKYGWSKTVNPQLHSSTNTHAQGHTHTQRHSGVFPLRWPVAFSRCPFYWKCQPVLSVRPPSLPWWQKIPVLKIITLVGIHSWEWNLRDFWVTIGDLKGDLRVFGLKHTIIRATVDHSWWRKQKRQLRY